MTLTPVLIVGAGPAGLVAALDLTARGVGVVIIDASAGATAASRAKGIQPRTLEILESLGVIDEILTGGGPFPRWRSYSAGTVAWEKSIYDLLGIGEPGADPAIPFPQTWMVPQWHTERVLRDALSRRGVHVESGTTLSALDFADTTVSATVTGPTGQRCIEASYIIGADGAASTVRKLLRVTFDGVTRESERHVIADVRTTDLNREYWHNFSTPTDAGARVSICPLPRTDVFQFVAPLLAGTPTPPLTLPTIQRLFDERSDGVAATFTDAPWSTVTKANERLASSFRVGPVFLVGDAAHTVPAAGGQGMNTAIQDSHNLGWKLATVLHGGPDSLLDTYEEERRPIAARLMAGEKTDVFQLRNNYRGSSLSDELRARTGSVQAGDRAPDAPLAMPGAAPTRLFEYGAAPTCIAFGDDAAHACRVVGLPVLDVRRESPATAEVVHDVYDVHADESVAFLIRPDGHIGLVADRHIEYRLGAYLDRITADT